MPQIMRAKGAKKLNCFKISALGEITGRGGMKNGYIRHALTRSAITDVIDDWLINMKTGDTVTITITKEQDA